MACLISDGWSLSQKWIKIFFSERRKHSIFLMPRRQTSLLAILKSHRIPTFLLKGLRANKRSHCLRCVFVERLFQTSFFYSWPPNQACEMNRPRMNGLHGSTPLRTKPAKRSHVTIFGAVNKSLLWLSDCAFLVDYGEQQNSCNRKKSSAYHYHFLGTEAWIESMKEQSHMPQKHLIFCSSTHLFAY